MARKNTATSTCTDDIFLHARRELSAEMLDAVVGGQTTMVSSSAWGGPYPGHRYVLTSDTYGQNMSFADMNYLGQRYNAATRDVLYGNGNSPTADLAVI